MTAEKQFIFETDDLVRVDQETNEIFFHSRITLSKKRFGVMINFEFIEQVKFEFLFVIGCYLDFLRLQFDPISSIIVPVLCLMKMKIS